MIWLVSHARGIPDNDYWYIFGPIVRSTELFPSFSDFYDKSNEHVVAGAKLFYLLNFYVTDGDNIGLSIITVLFSFLIALILAVSVVRPQHMKYDRIAIGLIVSVFVFNPLAAHNFFLGMSGVAWVGANLFMVLAAAVLRSSAENDRRAGFLLAVALAAVSSQFYSTGVSAVFVLGIQGICFPRTRRIGAALLLLGVACIFWFWLNQEVPASHGPRSFDPLGVVWFCLMFIGGAITRDVQAAFLWGIGGVSLAAIVAIQTLINPREAGPKGAFWIALMAYACIAGGLAAVGRSNMGSDTAALASRYATIPSLFWIGLFGALLGVAEISLRARRLVLVVFAGLAILAVTNGWARVSSALHRSGGKDFATLALSMGVMDSLAMKYVTPVAAQYFSVEDDLRRVGHVPFNGRDFGCPELGSHLAARIDGKAVAGSVDSLSATDDPAWARVAGWAIVRRQGWLRFTDRLLHNSYGCVAFVDEEGTVVGVGAGGLHRPDVASALQGFRSDYGWIGYVDTGLLSRKGGPRPVYAAFKTSGGWVRLPQSLELKQDAASPDRHHAAGPSP